MPAFTHFTGIHQCFYSDIVTSGIVRGLDDADASCVGQTDNYIIFASGISPFRATESLLGMRNPDSRAGHESPILSSIWLSKNEG
jgi:hypothetical protein